MGFPGPARRDQATAERRRLALTLFAAGCALYAVRAAVQFRTLDAAGLHWDFEQFYTAARNFNLGISPYAGVERGCGYDYCLGGYVYPPLMAELLRPLATLSLVHAGAVWLVVVHACAIGSFRLGYRMLREVLRPESALLLTSLGLLYGPVYESLFFAQLGTPILLLTLLGARGMQRDSRRGSGMAGLALGLATVLKVAPAIAMMALAIPRPRRPGAVIAAIAAGASTLALVAVMLAATPATVTYVTDVALRVATVPTATRANVSGPAMLVRLVQLTGHAAPERLLTGALAVAILGTTMVFAARVADVPPMITRARLAALAAFIAATPLVTTITWPHHLALEFAVLVLLAVGMSPLPPDAPVRPAVLWLGAAGYVLTFVDRAMVEAVLAVLRWQSGPPAGAFGLAWVAVVHVNTGGMLLIWIAALLVLRARASASSLEPAGAAGGPGSRTPALPAMGHDELGTLAG